MTDLVDIGAVDEFPDGEPRHALVGETAVCVARVGSDVFAVHDTCSHAFESLSGGWIEDGQISCPRHGAMFDLTTGEARTPPATRAIPVFSATISNGRVLIDPTPNIPHPLTDS